MIVYIDERLSFQTLNSRQRDQNAVLSVMVFLSLVHVKVRFVGLGDSSYKDL